MKFIYSVILMLAMSVSAMAQTKTRIGYDQVTLGNSTNFNKLLKFDIGNGSTNPGIRANDSTGLLEWSQNGSTWTVLGTANTGVAAIANGGTNNGSLSVASGTIYYGDGSKLVGLAPGTAGQLLQTNAAAAPSWVTQIVQQAVAASAIDWSTANAFTKTLSANTTFTFSNPIAGQNISVRLTNTASNYTVTWPSVRWTGGIAPVMTIGAKSDVYTFYYDGSNYYGSYVQDMF